MFLCSQWAASDSESKGAHKRSDGFNTCLSAFMLEMLAVPLQQWRCFANCTDIAWGCALQGVDPFTVYIVEHFVDLDRTMLELGAATKHYRRMDELLRLISNDCAGVRMERVPVHMLIRPCGKLGKCADGLILQLAYHISKNVDSMYAERPQTASTPKASSRRTKPKHVFRKHGFSRGVAARRRLDIRTTVS